MLEGFVFYVLIRDNTGVLLMCTVAGMILNGVSITLYLQCQLNSWPDTHMYDWLKMDGNAFMQSLNINISS